MTRPHNKIERWIVGEQAEADFAVALLTGDARARELLLQTALVKHARALHSQLRKCTKYSEVFFNNGTQAGTVVVPLTPKTLRVGKFLHRRGLLGGAVGTYQVHDPAGEPAQVIGAGISFRRPSTIRIYYNFDGTMEVPFA